jgi:hypothetical protein
VTSKFDCFTVLVCVLGFCVAVEPVVEPLVDEVPDPVVVPLLELFAGSDVFSDFEVDEPLAAESVFLLNKLETRETRAPTTPARIDTILPIVEVLSESAANCVCALATMDSSDDRSAVVAAAA